MKPVRLGDKATGNLVSPVDNPGIILRVSHVSAKETLVREYREIMVVTEQMFAVWVGPFYLSNDTLVSVANVG